MARVIESIRVEGLKELEERLKDLPLHIAERAMTSGLRYAAKPMLKMAKENALRTKHPSSGALSASMGFRAGRKPKNKPKTQVFIGPIRSDKKAAAMYGKFYKKEASGIFHGHLIEFGTDKQSAQPWFRPAIDATAGQIPQDFGKYLSIQIDKRLKKLKAGSK